MKTLDGSVLPQKLGCSSSFSSMCAKLMAAPRTLVPLALLGAVASASGCVPATHYEEAASAADVEKEAHRRAVVDLEAEKARVARLQTELQSRDQGLVAGEQKLAEEKFERGVAAKERDDSLAVLEQLRADLVRANESLRAYAEKNARLEQELQQARAQALQAEAPVASPEPAREAPPIDPQRWVGQIKAALAAADLDKKVSVLSSGDEVVLRVPADVMFDSGSAGVRPEILKLFDTAAALLVARPELRCRIREGNADLSLSESLRRERRQRLASELGQRRLGERVKWQSLAGQLGAPNSYELILGQAARGSTS